MAVALTRAFARLSERLAAAETRAPLSRALAPLWPPRAAKALGLRATRGDAPAPWVLLEAPEGGTLDVDPVSGDVFLGRDRVAPPAPGGVAPDMRMRLNPPRASRMAVAPLYRGAGAGIGDFVLECLPAFFALDALDSEGAFVGELPLRLGRRGFAQDALEDGVFRPRPVELMNPRKLVSARRVLLIAPPPPDAAFLERLWSRLDDVYPGSGHQEMGAGAAEIVLGRGGIDPETLRLDRLVSALRAARIVRGADARTLAAVTLAGPGPRTVIVGAGAPDSRLRMLADAAGWELRVSD